MAKAFISAIKNEFLDASHNCWAYVAGPPGNTGHVGMSDDGEPRGTAGKPMLAVLLHSAVGEIAAVVTRYFGGIKLGKGGLVRAYSGAVQNALAGLAVKEKRITRPYTVIFGYSKISAIKQVIESFNAEITQEKYGAEVSFEVELPQDDEDSFARALINLTGGEIDIRKQS